MSLKNYTNKITVNNSAESAYVALTEGMAKWWTKPDAPMTKVGDRSKFSFPPGKSFWTFEARLLEPQRRVEMMCVEALHIHDGMPKDIEREWRGTKIIWSIRPNGDNVDIYIEHVGLVPGLHCYEICKVGWDFFFVDSLQVYLNTGVGKPHRP